MSAPEELTEALRWLEYARQDLRAAENALNSSAFAARHVCWLAQQAAEKSLKAALIYEQIAFPWKHDLDALRNLLPNGWQIKTEEPDLAALTEWSVEARYPGEWPEPSQNDAWRAIEQARRIYKSIEQAFETRGP